MSRQGKPTFETENEIFPTRLRELMEIENITQTQLGDAIGVRRQTVSLYTTGQSKPDWEQITKICKFLNCSSDYLLGLSDFRVVEDKVYSDAICSEISDLLTRLFDNLDRGRVRQAVLQMIDGFKAASWCGYDEYCTFETAVLHITVALKAIAQCLAYTKLKDIRSLSKDEQRELSHKLKSILDDATNAILKATGRFSGSYNRNIMKMFPGLIDINIVTVKYAHDISQLLNDAGIKLD